MNTRPVKLAPGSKREALWFHVVLSTLLSPQEVSELRRDLHRHLRSHGIVAAIASSRIAILPSGRRRRQADIAIVQRWLMGHSGVERVRIDGASVKPCAADEQRAIY